LFQDHKEGEKNMKMPLKKSFRRFADILYLAIAM